MKSMNLTRDDVLATIGLQTRRSASDYIFPALGLFGLGLLTGGGLGLLFAPKRGDETRELVGSSVRGASKKLMSKLRRRAQDAVHATEDALEEAVDAVDAAPVDRTVRSPFSANA